jgi:predicted DCC family thiol-disulfide oxidoreductase YuxK
MTGPARSSRAGAPSGADVGDVVFYDGRCGLCDRFVSFVITRDEQARFRFAPLEGAFARTRLAAPGLASDAPSTVVVLTAGGQLFVRSEAVFFVLRALGGRWRALALLRFFPRRLTDWGYDQIAQRRYRWFGRLPTCRIPSPEERRRFVLDDAAEGA